MQTFCLMFICLCPSALGLSSPSVNKQTMLWDNLFWLLALLALSYGGLPLPNEPLSAPRIFLSFKGKAKRWLETRLCITLCVCPVCRHVDFSASLSCLMTGMGKLLAPAEFTAWQHFVPSVSNREMNCGPPRRDEMDEEMLLIVLAVHFPKNMSSFNRQAANSLPKRPLCDPGSPPKSRLI